MRIAARASPSRPTLCRAIDRVYCCGVTRSAPPSRAQSQKPGAKSAFTLRDVALGDFDALLRLDQECFVEGIAYTEKELGQFLHHRGAFTIVAEDAAGKLAGFVIALVQKKFAWIITIDIRPDARRHGLASRLMREVEARLREREIIGVMLEVAVDNVPAITFYKRLGYEISRTIPRYYLNKLDAFEMIKSLDSGC
jgi:ribosomal protein S18 acetylase RimI-like enzyme